MYTVHIYRTMVPLTIIQSVKIDYDPHYRLMKAEAKLSVNFNNPGFIKIYRKQRLDGQGK